jgi:type IV pilus assembly protein PilW
MSQQLFPPKRSRSNERGLSLIELLVAMAIGLVVTLAITTVLINSQGLQRTSTALNDASQTGAFATLTLDRATRSAGSGFTQFRAAMGCVLNAAITTPALQTLLPVPTSLPWPAPFSNIDGSPGRAAIVLAPVVIVDGGGPNGDDQLVVMTGNHAFSETARAIDTGTATVNSVVVSNAMGMRANDLVLVADTTPGSGCMIQQIAAPALNVQVPMAGTYFNSVGATRALATFAASSAIVPLGWMSNVAGTPNNPPSFMIYGVGADNFLYGYDILNTTGATAVPVGENVLAMHALYGVRTSATAPVTWVAPTGATYGASALWGATTTAQSAAVRNTIQSIRAVRIAVVLRSAVEERQTTPQVSPANLVLFPDLPLTDSRHVVLNLTTAQRNFR